MELVKLRNLFKLAAFIFVIAIFAHFIFKVSEDRLPVNRQANICNPTSDTVLQDLRNPALPPQCQKVYNVVLKSSWLDTAQKIDNWILIASGVILAISSVVLVYKFVERRV